MAITHSKYFGCANLQYNKVTLFRTTITYSNHTISGIKVSSTWYLEFYVEYAFIFKILCKCSIKFASIKGRNDFLLYVFYMLFNNIYI